MDLGEAEAVEPLSISLKCKYGVRSLALIVEALPVATAGSHPVNRRYSVLRQVYELSASLEQSPYHSPVL